MAFFSRLFGRRKEDVSSELPHDADPEPPQISKRALTSGEADVLRIVQEEYGPQITEEEVSFTPAAHLVIKAPDGEMITTISLSAFAQSIEDGKVNEQELRNDWIRDSRSVLARYRKSSPSPFKLASRGRECDLVLVAGHRKVEVSYDIHRNGDNFKYVFYPISMRCWDYPFAAEPLTKPLKKEIFAIIMELLEAKHRGEVLARGKGRLEFRIEW